MRGNARFAEGNQLNENSGLGFIHRFEAATNAAAPALLLLHGSGGDENSLLPLGRAVAPGAALLSPRGKVADFGSSRFFERTEGGPESDRDRVERTEELVAFVAAATSEYRLQKVRLLLLGFSGGATIGVHLLLRAPDRFSGAVFMRGMRPFDGQASGVAACLNLNEMPVLLLSGIHDPLVQSDQAQDLADFLRQHGATVRLHWEEAGHSLSQGDVLMAFDWIKPYYSRQRGEEHK